VYGAGERARGETSDGRRARRRRLLAPLAPPCYDAPRHTFWLLAALAIGASIGARAPTMAPRCRPPSDCLKWWALPRTGSCRPAERLRRISDDASGLVVRRGKRDCTAAPPEPLGVPPSPDDCAASSGAAICAARSSPLDMLPAFCCGGRTLLRCDVYLATMVA
jgi:hypothetical protein